MSGDSITLFPKAADALRAIGKWGHPLAALHWTHRRFFNRHSLVETHSPGRVRTTAKADAMLAEREAASLAQRSEGE